MKSYQSYESVTKKLYKALVNKLCRIYKEKQSGNIYVGFIKKLGRFVSVMNFSSIYEF